MTSMLDHWAEPQVTVASTWLEVPPGSVSLERIVLRGFDELRREIAAQIEGRDGIGAGYDVLDIRWAKLRDLEPKARFKLEARVLNRRTGRHEVEYVASILVEQRASETKAVVAVRARGWTLCPEASSR